MEKETFKLHLYKATTMLVDFTKILCCNGIAENYKYRITPNSRTVDNDDEHLTEEEIAVLNMWNKYENQNLTAEQIVELFHRDNKVPVWVDTTIYEAGKNFTVIDLFCSRRLRDDNELYHQGQIMPFHLQVAMPPDRLKFEKNGKFDVNWKKILDDKRKPKAFLARLEYLLNFAT